MERNTHDIIQSKVRSEEASPFLGWDKHGAWEKIRQNVEHKRIVWPYYAAASITALLCVLIYAVKPNTTFSERLERIDKTLLSLENSSQRQVDHTPVPKIEAEQACTTKTHALKKAVSVRSIHTETHEPELISEIATPITRDTIQYVNDAVLAVVNVEAEPEIKVQPIIGVIPPTQEVPDKNLARNKKLKVRLFNDNKEPSFAEQIRETKLVIARIK